MELDLGAVRTFLAVVDDGHFTDAADRLGMTRAAAEPHQGRGQADRGRRRLPAARAGAD